MLQTKFIFAASDQIEHETNDAIQSIYKQGMKVINVLYNTHANKYRHVYSSMILYDTGYSEKPEKPDTDPVAYCSNCNRFLTKNDIDMHGILAVCKNCGVGGIAPLYTQ